MSSPKVSYSDLEDAFLFASEERYYWLDKHTGRVLSYGWEVARALEEGEDLSDLPDWQREEAEAARQVLSAFGELPEEYSQCSVVSGQWSVADPSPGSDESTSEASAEECERNNRTPKSNRYVPIEQIPSNEAFQFMSDFADELAESPIRDVLQRALRGKRPFHRFKASLSNFPKERERWFQFESLHRRDYIQEWARDEGIEIDFSGERG
ncbi:MAG: UPF0158 family protein [Acidobacteriota bacterium]